MVPGKNGGTNIIYTNILRPFVLKHQEHIDKSIGNAKEAFGKGKMLRNILNFETVFKTQFFFKLSVTIWARRKNRQHFV